MAAFEFDNPDQYVEGTPYEAFARLRRDSPFAWHASAQQPRKGFWLVTRHHHIVSISKNPKMFATHAPLLADPIPRQLWPAYPALAMIADNLLTFDHQKHPVFKPLATALFSAARLEQTVAEIRAACAGILARVAEAEPFDFAADVALAVPVQIILGRFLGIPAGDLAELSSTILAINAMDDPFFSPHPDSMMQAANALGAYGLGLLRRIRATPGSDLISEIVCNRRPDGVSQEQLFVAFWFPLAAGAFDTTAATIAGGVRALLEHPAELERLRADPSLVPSAVEEMIRWVSPVIYFRRTAVAETAIDGQTIKKDDRLILCYASANRDEAVFPDADRFDVGRQPNNHVSFGYGPHFCLGARLAAIVIRVFLEEFLKSAPALALDGPVRHTRSNWMNRIRSMPVRRLG